MTFFLSLFFLFLFCVKQKAENTADIKIGTMIAVMVEEGDDWQSAEVPDTSFDTPTSDSTPPTPSPPTQAPTSSQQTATEISQYVLNYYLNTKCNIFDILFYKFNMAILFLPLLELATM